MLKFLGTGSAFNTKLGNTSAYWKNQDKMFLIDCGENIFEKIQNSKVLDDIKELNIFVTHGHFDHIGSLSTLIYYCYFVKKIKVNVFYPDKDLKIILDLVGHQSYEYSYYQENALTFGDFGYVVFKETNHIPKTRAYSLEINVDKERIYYSGDSCDVIDFSKTEYTKIYHDVSNYKGGVHTYVEDFIKVNKGDNRIWCMHFDSDETIKKCLDAGFNICVKESV